MSNATVASWTACIKELQRLVNTAAAGAADDDLRKAGIAMGRNLEKLTRQPPLPHAAWKRLVQDVQVIMKTACLAGSELSPESKEVYRRYRPHLARRLAFAMIGSTTGPH
jgi:hypothetical protein